MFLNAEDNIFGNVDLCLLQMDVKCFMVTPCINNIQHFIVQLMHTTLKKRIVIKTFLKIRKLLQYVSVYKETIIREPQPVLT